MEVQATVLLGAKAETEANRAAFPTGNGSEDGRGMAGGSVSLIRAGTGQISDRLAKS